MDCKDLDGILGNTCNYSIGGISQVWIMPFDDVSDFIYDLDYLHKVVGFSSLSVPTLYEPNKKTSEYNGTKSLTNYNMYEHTLTLGFSKMESYKREELMKLAHMNLTVIFKDNNGLCWIMGQDYACKLSDVKVGTGVQNGSNVYELVFQSIEQEHLRQVECIVEGCFTSFKGIEKRTSIFSIEEASSLDWSELILVVDSTTITHYPTIPLDPSNWSTPSIYARDLNELTLFFGSYGTLDSLTAVYDSFLDIVTITAISQDSTYGGFDIGGSVFGASVNIDINFISTLSPLIANPTTIIELTDSLGTVYSLPYGDAVVGSGLSGISNNSIINVSSLYPSGTTFTVSLVGLACSSNEYVYVYEPYIGVCSASVDFDFFKGEYMLIDVPCVIHDINTPRFQNLELNIFGTIFQLYKNISEWHDDVVQFENDVINILSQVPTIVDMSSLVFVDNVTYIQIKFKTFNVNNTFTNPFFNSIVEGYSGTSKVVTNEGWKQSWILDLNTTAPYPSFITHLDGFSNYVDGDNIIDIQNITGFTLGNTPLTNNNSIDEVGLLWAFDGLEPYGELSEIDTSFISPSCLIGDINSSFVKCFTTYTETTDDNIFRLSLDVSSGSVDIGTKVIVVTSNGSTSILLGGSVTPTTNHHLLTSRLSAIKDLQVIDMFFDCLNQTYFIYMKISNGVSVLSVQETTSGRYFSSSSVSQIKKESFDNSINPFVEVEWTYQWTAESAQTTIARNLTHGHWYQKDMLETIYTVDWDSGADTITTIKDSATTTCTIRLHEVYPTASNSFYNKSKGVGSTGGLYTTVSASLLSNGSNVSLIKFISFTNSVGVTYVYPFDMTTSPITVVFEEKTRIPRAWGTFQSLEISGIGGGAIVLPFVNTISLICP